MPDKTSAPSQPCAASSGGKRPCVFLDRDGVINSGGLLNAPSDVVLLDGVVEAIISLKQAGFLTGICSNQNGLSEDFEGNVVWKQRPLTRDKLAAIHAELFRQLGLEALPNFVQICPHAKKLDCGCRKPKAGMLLSAAHQHHIDLSRSFMIGDMYIDIMAGINAGVTPLLVLTGFDPEQKDRCPPGTLVFPSLKEAAAFVLQSSR